MNPTISPWDKWMNEVLSGKKFPRLPLLQGNAIAYLAEEIVQSRGYFSNEQFKYVHNIELTSRYSL